MPLRPFSRDLRWLLPPSLDELVAKDHPARFVAAFVDALDMPTWAGMEIELAGDPLGAPAYDPRALLSVWVYGFMTGVRSSRKLEAACRDQMPYLWLTGWQRPDHNTLWRFYQAHREQMRKLLKRTVKTAVRLGLVDLAVQAVDGTKIPGNAARERTYDRGGLERLLKRTEAAILELEAQNRGGDEGAPSRLPEDLTRAETLKEQVAAALEQLKAEEAPKEVNLSDPEARLMKGRQGLVAGYNAQAVVSGLDKEKAGTSGLLITGAEAVNDPDDHAQLVPMLEEAREMTGQVAGVSLADGGYHSGENLKSCQERGQRVLMPEAQDRAMESLYHKDRFRYDPETDSYTCPRGHTLRFAGIKHRKNRRTKRVYRALAAICRACPVFGECTKDGHQGRALEVGEHETILRNHRTLMATGEAKARYKLRKQLVEPVFGILKEKQGARRFLLRGLHGVRAEWVLLATAFNLNTLHRVWSLRPQGERSALLSAASG